MTPIMKRTEKDDAVSPVVGVMLMLVVTIIIAAVVAAFASGVATQTEAAPNVILKTTVDFDQTFATGNGVVYLTSVNGDQIDLSKVAITISGTETYRAGGTSHSRDYSYTFESPIHSMPNGKFLKSGCVLNCGYGIDEEGNGKSLSELLDEKVDDYTHLKAGDVVHVTVVYDNTHILYDKEVIAE